MTEVNRPIFAGQLLGHLYGSVRDGKKIDNIPGLVVQLIEEDIWREVYIKELEYTVKYDKFEDIIITPPPEGLGTTVDILKRLIVDNKTLSLLDEVLRVGPGAPLGNLNQLGTIDDNIHNSRESPTGTSRQAGLRRLRKDRPDLHKKVNDGDMTVNAAMVEAGFRAKTFTLPLDVAIIAKKLKERLTTDQLNDLISKLGRENTAV